MHKWLNQLKWRLVGRLLWSEETMHYMGFTLLSLGTYDVSICAAAVMQQPITSFTATTYFYRASYDRSNNYFYYTLIHHFYAVFKCD